MLKLKISHMFSVIMAKLKALPKTCNLERAEF